MPQSVGGTRPVCHRIIRAVVCAKMLESQGDSWGERVFVAAFSVKFRVDPRVGSQLCPTRRQLGSTVTYRLFHDRFGTWAPRGAAITVAAFFTVAGWSCSGISEEARTQSAADVEHGLGYLQECDTQGRCNIATNHRRRINTQGCECSTEHSRELRASAASAASVCTC